MALTKPILANKVAFDATQDSDFNFNVIGGDSYDRVILTVVNQFSGSVVYNHSFTTFANKITLPADSLVNGDYYSAYIQTSNTTLGETSEQSNAIQFYCYTTPIFQFTNISDNDTINSSVFEFQLNYSQEENELLSSYIFNLYNVQGSLIATSGTIYISDLEIIFPVSYTFDGFTNNTFYKIQAQGQTEGGTILQTDIIDFGVAYASPSAYSTFELTGNCMGGYITVKSNFTTLKGDIYPEPPIFVNNNTALDLTNTNAYVNWDKDFRLSENFTMQIWGYDFNEDSRIALLKDAEGNSIELKYNRDLDTLNEDLETIATTEFFVSAFVESGNQGYYVFSDNIALPSSSDILQIWLRRINGLYILELYNLGTEPE